MRKQVPSPLKPLTDSNRWLQSLGALLLAAVACSVLWQLAAFHSSSFLADEPHPELFTLVAPASLANSSEWRAIDGRVDAEVSSDDLLHLSFLEAACQVENDTLLPWTFAAPGNAADKAFPNPKTSTSLLHRGDPRLLDELRKCPDVDIYLPSAARGPAGCAAIAGPLKYLRSRLLPHWALESKVYDVASKKKLGYFDVCPNTSVLFLSPDHVLQVAKAKAWLQTKPVYLMAPTVQLEPKAAAKPINYTKAVLELTDVVLCRTMRCDQDVKQFLVQRAKEAESSDALTSTRVLYTSQVTADAANFARRMLDSSEVRPNLADFAYTRFAHATWNVTAKTTQDVFSCWNAHKKELPPLDVYVLRGLHENRQNDGARLYKPFPGDSSTKVQVLDAVAFAQQFGQASFFVCPTAADDCLDLARAAGGVVVTPDAYPMNEFVSSQSEGVLFPTQQSLALPQAAHRSLVPDDYLLLPPPAAKYRSADLCAAVLQTRASLSLTQRKSIGLQTRRRFHEDAKFFMLSMLELQAFTAHKRSLRERVLGGEEPESPGNLRHS